jgi:hypothetical protein
MCDLYLCAFQFWHKLYADSMIIKINHQHLVAFLTTLHEVSCEHDLRVNPKKYTVFAIKNHCKLSEDMYLKGIPVVTEYCCQIVVIKIIYVVLRSRSHQSNVVPTICEPIFGTTRRTCTLRISIYYKSFTCSRIFCTQHRLLKRKLKICKRVSTAYTLTP